MIFSDFIQSLKHRLSCSRPMSLAELERETAAMVYGGDIYTVLVRDRAVRELAYRGGRVQQASDAVLPFIR